MILITFVSANILAFAKNHPETNVSYKHSFIKTLWNYFTPKAKKELKEFANNICKEGSEGEKALISICENSDPKLLVLFLDETQKSFLSRKKQDELQKISDE